MNAEEYIFERMRKLEEIEEAYKKLERVQGETEKKLGIVRRIICNHIKKLSSGPYVDSIYSGSYEFNELMEILSIIPYEEVEDEQNGEIGAC